MSARRGALVVLIALGASAVSAGAVLAAFNATATNPGNSFSAAPDFVAPSASSSVIVRQNGGVAGYVRQGGSYYVYANVTDTGNPASGTASATGDVSAVTTGGSAAGLSSGSYTVAGATYNWRSSLLSAKGTLAEASYAYTLSLADNASNSRVQTGFSVTVDNTAPTASDVQGLPGGTSGQIDVGDALTYTYSEPIDPTTILAGWNGSATTINTTFEAGNSPDMYTDVALGTVALGQRAYGGSGIGATFTATMVMSGSAVTVTLASQTSGGNSRSMNSHVMVWTPSTAATDRAGNAASSASATESGGNDADF